MSISKYKSYHGYALDYANNLDKSKIKLLVHYRIPGWFCGFHVYLKKKFTYADYGTDKTTDHLHITTTCDPEAYNKLFNFADTFDHDEYICEKTIYTIFNINSRFKQAMALFKLLLTMDE